MRFIFRMNAVEAQQARCCNSPELHAVKSLGKPQKTISEDGTVIQHRDVYLVGHVCSNCDSQVSYDDPAKFPEGGLLRRETSL